MNIEDSKKIMKTEIELSLSPTGRPLSEEAIANLDSCLADFNNIESEAVQCINCGMVQSILLIDEGCENCGCLDIEADISEGNMYNFFKNSEHLFNWVKSKNSLNEAFDVIFRVFSINSIGEVDALDIKDCLTGIFNENDKNASDILFELFSRKLNHKRLENDRAGKTGTASGARQFRNIR